MGSQDPVNVGQLNIIVISSAASGELQCYLLVLTGKDSCIARSVASWSGRCMIRSFGTESRRAFASSG